MSGTFFSPSLQGGGWGEGDRQAISWGKRLAPLIATQAFLWLTLALFAWGPWQWPLRNPETLYAFVIAAHLALAIGYLSAAHRAPVEAPQADPYRLIRISLWLTVLVLPITAYARTGHWIPDFLGSVRDPGKAYLEAHLYADSGSNPGTYVRILAAPALAILVPIGVLYWAILSSCTRWAMAGVVAATIVLAISTGQRREIADLLIVVPFLIVAGHASGITRLGRRSLIGGSCAALLFLAAFSTYFGFSHASRVGQRAAEFASNPATQQLPDLDNPILSAFPEPAQPAAAAMLNYLTTSYFGLALALDRPVEPMYGAGHSMFLTRNAARLTNDATFESRSLPVQISDKDGFKYPVYWCTAYPYFANDIGFLGVIALLLFLGRGLCLTWIDTLGGKNPLAAVLFSLLLLMIIYLPATNRILQDGEGVIAFYAWLGIWGCARLRRRTCPKPCLA